LADWHRTFLVPSLQTDDEAHFHASLQRVSESEVCANFANKNASGSCGFSHGLRRHPGRESELQPFDDERQSRTVVHWPVCFGALLGGDDCTLMVDGSEIKMKTLLLLFLAVCFEAKDHA